MKSYPDSYLHFENLDAPETQNFAAEAHAETRARFLDNDKARALSDGILAQMQDTIPHLCHRAFQNKKA